MYIDPLFSPFHSPNRQKVGITVLVSLVIGIPILLVTGTVAYSRFFSFLGPYQEHVGVLVLLFFAAILMVVLFRMK